MILKVVITKPIAKGVTFKFYTADIKSPGSTTAGIYYNFYNKFNFLIIL